VSGSDTAGLPATYARPQIGGAAEESGLTVDFKARPAVGTRGAEPAPSWSRNFLLLERDARQGISQSLIRHAIEAALAAHAARLAVTPLEREGGQTQFIVHEAPASNVSLSPVLRWLKKNLSSSLNAEEDRRTRRNESANAEPPFSRVNRHIAVAVDINRSGSSGPGVARDHGLGRRRDSIRSRLRIAFGVPRTVQQRCRHECG